MATRPPLNFNVNVGTASNGETGKPSLNFSGSRPPLQFGGPVQINDFAPPKDGLISGLFKPNSDPLAKQVYNAVNSYTPEPVKDAFSWVGKQLMKPVGVTARELRGLTDAATNLVLGHLTGHIDVDKADKQAWDSFISAQEDAWDIIMGDKESSFTKELGISKEGAAAKLREKGIEPEQVGALESALSLGADIMLDPLNLVPTNWLGKAGKLIGKGAEAVGLAKPAMRFTEALYKSKPAKTLKWMFKSTTDNKEAQAVIDKFRNLYKYREGELIDESVRLGKDLEKLKKINPGVETIITDALEDVSLIDKITDKPTRDIVENLQKKYADSLADIKRVGLTMKEVEEYTPHIRTKESFGVKIKNMLGMREFGTANIEKVRQLIKLKPFSLTEDGKMIFEGAAKVGKKSSITSGMTKLLKEEIEKEGLSPLREYYKTKDGKLFQTANATINDLSKIGVDIFEKSPAIQLAKKGQAYVKAITSKEFADEISRFARAAGEGGKEVTNPILKGLRFDEDIANVIDNFYQGIQPEELNVILKGFDKIQNLWKAQALISPSYHIRNMAGNLWNNYVAGVNPWAYAKATKYQTLDALKDYEKGLDIVKGTLSKSPIKKGFGVEMKKVVEEIDEMKRLGVIDDGWYAADIRDEVINRVKGAGKFNVNPLSQENALLKLNKASGKVVENNAKMAHYFSKKAQGFSPEQAAASVKKYLFDYNDLTKFEKTVLKRVFPFYTWTRKNLPLQLEGLITQPGKYALPHKIVQEIQSGVDRPNEKYMQPYLTENIPVRIKKNKDGNTEYFLLGTWLPYASAIDFLSNPWNSIVGMVTPAIKEPYEQITNNSTFFKNTLGESGKVERYEQEPGEFLGIPMRKKMVNLFSNIRILNDINKLVDKKDPLAAKNSWRVKLMNVLFGKTQTYDVGKSKYYYDQDTEDKINEYKSAIKNAQKKNYSEMAVRLAQELKEFQHMRQGN